MEKINLQYTFPAELPISAKVREIIDLWQQHQLIIVGGATGSGKTTQLPKIALAAGFGVTGRIGCTQPRRIAATAMARRVSSEIKVQYDPDEPPRPVECGHEVGYQVRFDDKTGKDTVIKFMTDGILLAETANDRQLRQYEVLIIDEAHERSLNIDFLLGYLKNLMARRRDLKIAISSATLDMEQFSRFFANAPVVEVEGRMFPVEDLYLEPESADEELPEHVARAISYLNKHGDILVFLPGEREIRECADLLTGRKLPNTEILPLFARLGYAEQQRVFSPGRLRRIILATNVAETSITIPGIKYCIDSGQVRVSRYNPRSRIQELQIETVSQASARQRRGRCGRTADGVCVHLYSEDDLLRSAPYTDPEIRRTSLAGVILRMASLRLPRIDCFPFIDPPPSVLVREGMRTLEDLRAILPGGKITPEGWILAALPIDPHLGKMLLTGKQLNVLPEILAVTAFLSIQDPRERPADKQQMADEAHRRWRNEKSDFCGILELWNLCTQSTVAGGKVSSGALRRFCRSNFLNFNRMREWRNLFFDLADSCRNAGGEMPELADDIVFADTPYEQLHVAILSGVPRQIAKYVPEYQYFLGTGGRKYTLFPGSGLFKRKNPPPWLMSFALVETSRLYGRCNAEIMPEFLPQSAPHMCLASYDMPKWDEKSGFVYAKEKISSGGLVLFAGRRVHYGKINPVESRDIFIRAALVTGAVNLPGTWVEKHVAMLRGLENLELKIRRPGTVVDYEAIAGHFLEFLPPDIFSTEALKKLCATDRTDYSLNRADMMQPQHGTLQEEDYPDFLVFSGHKFALRYFFEPGGEDDGSGLLVREDELNLLPPWALDWGIDGLLPERLERVLKGLPRELRRRITPIADRIREFIAALNAGKVFRGQALIDALCEFLNTDFDVDLSPRDFGEVDMPEYLRLKIYVMNEKNELRTILREVPAGNSIASRLSCAVRGVKELSRSNCSVWPPDLPELPESQELPGGAGKLAWPALVDEKESVGVQMFLRRSEAEMHHTGGLLRLFKLLHADQIKFIRRTFRLPREVLLAFFTSDQEKNYVEELTDATILAALGDDPWELRSAAAFAAAEKRAAENLGSEADAKLQTLIELTSQYEKFHDLANRLKIRPGVDSQDLRQHVNFLFAPGFLRRHAVWTEYRRFLRGAQLRSERMNGNPAKDREKLRLLEPWQEKFNLALTAAGSLEAAPELYKFWLLLEEARLAVFAPEVPLRTKAPLNKLEDMWREIHF